MNCTACGTALPGGALFCPECGRPVDFTGFAPTPRVSVPASAPAAASEAASPASSSAASSAWTAAALVASPPAPVRFSEAEFTCPQCGEAVDEDDVFCGECGFVLGVSEPRPPLSAFAPDLSDAAPVRPEPEPVAEVEEPVAEASPEPEPEPEPDPVVAVEPEPEPEPVVAVESEPEPVIPAPSAERAPLRQVPDPFPWGKDDRGTIDLEATRIVAGALPEERFVLQFSTGESVTVSGVGLIGRNPASQPGEFVDQLVTIFDAGKSVSKTHLEFGQDSGRFWVSDRYSTNGSTIRQPDQEPKRCEPGRRYFIARGTRVDIGEQFFVVS